MQADARDEERVYRLAVALYLATEATREKARELAIEADLT